MLIRDSDAGIDSLFCFFQGYVGANLINVACATAIDPLNAGVCLAITVFAERFFSGLTNQFVQGKNSFTGPFPTGERNIVSYCLATYSSFRVMQVAGMILTIPPVVQTLGILSVTVLSLSALYGTAL